jgi:hypothetical protein
MAKGIPKHREIITIRAKTNDMLNTDPLGIAALKPVGDAERVALALAPAAQEALIPAAWGQLIPDESGYAARLADRQPSRPVATQCIAPNLAIRQKAHIFFVCAKDVKTSKLRR